MEYVRITGANNYHRGPPGGHNPPGCTRAPRHALVGCGPLGPPSVPIFGYISDFDLEKIRMRLLGRSAAVSRRNLGRITFALCRGNFPLGGGNHRHHHHQQISHLGEGKSMNIFTSTISSQTLVHLWCSIFVPEL